MNLTKLISLLFLVLSIAACDNDDDDGMTACMQDDWVGTYTGRETCEDYLIDASTTVTITASGSDAIAVEYTSATVTTTFAPTIPNGCDFEQTNVDGSVTLTVSGTLDGDELTLRTVFSIVDINGPCTIVATRD